MEVLGKKMSLYLEYNTLIISEVNNKQELQTKKGFVDFLLPAFIVGIFISTTKLKILC